MRSVESLIGQRIRVRREACGLLQREMASLAGLPVRTVGRIERGEADMRVSTLTKIAGALGVSLKDLIP
jgi:transcriptional regulator with XRE-family HTH domain